MNLDTEFYPALWAMSSRLSTRPEFLLLTWYAESGLNPQSQNSLGYTGLNQLDSGYLRRLGVDPSEYRLRPASGQLSIIETFLRPLVVLNHGGFVSAANAYAANFWPVSLARGNGPSVVIVSANGPDGEPAAYRANSGLDFDKNGRITVGDLANHLAKLSGRADYKAALAALYAVCPPGVSCTPVDPVPAPSQQGRSVGQGLSVGELLGWGAVLATAFGIFYATTRGIKRR